VVPVVECLPRKREALSSSPSTEKKKNYQKVNEQISQKEVYIANKYMKKCLASLAIKEMQIKMSLRFHLTPVRMAIIKNRNNKCW
jgi:hypothetical protein